MYAPGTYLPTSGKCREPESTLNTWSISCRECGSARPVTRSSPSSCKKIRSSPFFLPIYYRLGWPHFPKSGRILWFNLRDLHWCGLCCKKGSSFPKNATSRCLPRCRSCIYSVDPTSSGRAWHFRGTRITSDPRALLWLLSIAHPECLEAYIFFIKHSDFWRKGTYHTHYDKEYILHSFLLLNRWSKIN